VTTTRSAAVSRSRVYGRQHSLRLHASSRSRPRFQVSSRNLQHEPASQTSQLVVTSLGSPRDGARWRRRSSQQPLAATFMSERIRHILLSWTSSPSADDCRHQLCFSRQRRNGLTANAQWCSSHPAADPLSRSPRIPGHEQESLQPTRSTLRVGHPPRQTRHRLRST
jgi:hypothetical protein